MKLVKEITPDVRESVDGGALYFNPVIYDYAKENNIPLYELLRCLQSSELCYMYFEDDNASRWPKSLVKKWFSLSPEGIAQEVIQRTGGKRYDEDSYRELLVMDMFGLTVDEAEKYQDTGHGTADEVLFGRLSELSEKQIKSPLDMKDVSLWDWDFEEGHGDYMIFYYYSDEEGQWYISPFIFGYAKSFERRNLLLNYNELPRSGK